MVFGLLMFGIRAMEGEFSWEGKLSFSSLEVVAKKILGPQKCHNFFYIDNRVKAIYSR